MSGMRLVASTICRPCSTISPYDTRPVSGRPSRAAATENPDMNPKSNPASSVSFAEIPSYAAGPSRMPGLANSVRRRAVLVVFDGEGVDDPQMTRVRQTRRGASRRKVTGAGRRNVRIGCCGDEVTPGGGREQKKQN